MKKYMLLIFTIFIFSPFQIGAQTQNQSQRERVDFPWVPRISAYEAYVKYKAGKAIILHAGGDKYNRRHILGAINLNSEELGKDTHLKMIQKLPREGIELFTYCY
jgi:hypothetical protein